MPRSAPSSVLSLVTAAESSQLISISGFLPVPTLTVGAGDAPFWDGELAVAFDDAAGKGIDTPALVPYVNDFQKVIPTMLGSRVRRVADMGFPQVGYQAFKLLAHQRLHEAVAHWQEKYPGVDIILIEPDPNDELMFETNILNFARRVEIARHGFESVTLKLASEYDDLRETCAKHGIEISAGRVRKVVRSVAKNREKTAAWRRILEQTTGALLRQSDQA